MSITLWVILSLITGYAIRALKGRIDDKRNGLIEEQIAQKGVHIDQKLRDIIEDQSKLITDLLEQSFARIDEGIEEGLAESKFLLEHIELKRKYERLLALLN